MPLIQKFCHSKKLGTLSSASYQLIYKKKKLKQSLATLFLFKTILWLLPHLYSQSATEINEEVTKLHKQCKIQHTTQTCNNTSYDQKCLFYRSGGNLIESCRFENTTMTKLFNVTYSTHLYNDLIESFSFMYISNMFHY